MLSIPFNFEPVETTNESTSYNLTAGQYAMVTPKKYGAALVADGEELFPRLSFIVASVMVTSATFIDVFKGVAGYVFEGSTQIFVGAGGTNGSIATNSNYGATKKVNKYGNTINTGIFSTSLLTPQSDTTDGITQDISLNGDEAIVARRNAGVNSVFVNYSMHAINVTPKSFWVSGGNAGITITGDEFTVELYNSIQ